MGNPSKVNENTKGKDLADFLEWESRMHESDFDGHTNFHILSFTQKLAWLSEAAVSTYLLARSNPGAACNSFFDKKSSSLRFGNRDGD